MNPIHNINIAQAQNGSTNDKRLFGTCDLLLESVQLTSFKTQWLQHDEKLDFFEPAAQVRR
jgi:hypothetical protein